MNSPRCYGLFFSWLLTVRIRIFQVQLRRNPRDKNFVKRKRCIADDGGSQGLSGKPQLIGFTIADIGPLATAPFLR